MFTQLKPAPFIPDNTFVSNFKLYVNFRIVKYQLKKVKKKDEKAQTIAASSSCSLGLYQNLLLHFMKFEAYTDRDTFIDEYKYNRAPSPPTAVIPVCKL